MAGYALATLAGFMALATLVLAAWTVVIRRGTGVLTSGATGCVALLGLFLVVGAASPLVKDPIPVIIEPGDDIGSALDDALGDVGLVPAVLEVSVAAEALNGEPLDLARLIERAGESGVRFDVEVHGVPDRDEDAIEIRWVRKDGSFETLSEGSLAAADQDSVVRLSDATRSKCRLDDGGWQPTDDNGVALSALVGTKPKGAAVGWHRLECEDGERRATRYIELRPGVVIASRRGAELELAWRTTLTDDSPAECEPSVTPPKSFDGASDLSLLNARFFGSSANIADAEQANLLVLDRAEDPALCAAARAVLRRGGAVVLTPEPTMAAHEACSDLLPRALRDAPMRDRRPRLRFIGDETFDHLPYPPSCALPDCNPVMASEVPRIGVGEQAERIEDACARSLSAFREPTDVCPRADPVVEVLGRGAPAPRDERDDEALRRHMQLDHRLLETTEVARRSAIRWDNRITWVFTAKPDPSTDPALVELAEASGDYVVPVPIRDAYGISLDALDPSPTTPRLSPRVDRSIAACRGDRCIDPLEVPVARLTPGGHAQSRSRPGVRGRIAGQFPESFRPYPAPVRFFAWTTDSLATTWSEAIDRLPPAHYIVTDESGTGLPPASLAVGTMVDRGHLLLLGYSPFEYHEVVDPPDRLPWRDACGAFRLPELSSGLVRSFAQAAMDVDARAGSGIRSVRETESGLLRVEVHRSLESGESLSALRFDSIDVVGHLIEFDIPTRSFTYIVDVSAVVRNECRPITPLVEGGASAPLVVCPTTPATREELPAEASLRALAAYTGGCYITADEPCAEPQRPVGRVWSGLFLTCVAAVWGLRLRRALRARGPVDELSNAEAHTQSRYDPPDELASAAGAWSGRASTWPRTGTFGGFRALEPGDRASAIVLDDLVILTRGDATIVPRVALRIEEAAPSTIVLVNLGASMRYPATRLPSKIRLVAHVAELVAGEVWRMRAPASVAAVGIDGSGEVVSSTALHPGRGEVEAAVLQSAERAARHASLPLPEQHDECGAAVYISDFQTEDLVDVSRWIAEHETAGIRVAGVLVFSPAEFQFVETGRLAGSGTPVDRVDWTPVDVMRAMRGRVEAVEAVFEGASGGLTIVSTEMDTRSIELTLAERRVFEILR